MQERLNNFLDSKYFVIIAIILVAIIGFCLGRVSGLQEKREPVRVVGSSQQISSGEVKGENTSNPKSDFGQTEAVVVASKSGTKYHYPWCAGAKQISAKNLISFASIELARSAGYTPASNCKGLK